MVLETVIQQAQSLSLCEAGGWVILGVAVVAAAAASEARGFAGHQTWTDSDGDLKG